jgi:hypothetical protein
VESDLDAGLDAQSPLAIIAIIDKKGKERPLFV